MRILIKNALILTMKNDKLEKMDVLVMDKRIHKIARTIETDNVDQVIDATNCVLMPGFKNAHTHSAMVFSRSSSDNLQLSDWLTRCIFPIEAHLKPEDIYHLVKVAFLEYLTSGITACYDMYFFTEEAIKAATEIGFKMSIMYLVSSDTIDKMEQIAFANKTMNRDLFTMTVGFHAEYTAEEKSLLTISKYVNDNKCFVSTHSSETLSEVEGCRERHDGLTPTQYFEKLGLLNYGGTMFHNVSLTDEDIKIYRKRNMYAVSCPGSNCKLASGISPITKLLQNGVNIAIGTDGAGSNNCLDFFKEMHLLYSLANIKEEAVAPITPYEILKMATVNGAHAMGLKDSDTLEIGKYADLILIDLNRPNMQPINNIVANIVYSGSKDNVKMTMINGKVLYLDRIFYVGEDVETIYKNAQKVSDRLNKHNNYR